MAVGYQALSILKNCRGKVLQYDFSRQAAIVDANILFDS